MENRNTQGRRYGLQVPKKPALGEVQPRHSIFGDDSDSEHEDGSDWVKKAFSKAASKSVQKKQTKLEIQRALKEDPTVYQYDEIYEQLEEKKQEAKSEKKAEEKKPRYIQTLMAHAERRKREQERRMERQVQKEREAEGEAFKDKEAFITSSYRKKLEEFRKLDEEERRQDELEAIGDVSKQEDLGGFYRHLYHQTLGENKPTIKQEKDSGGEKEVEVERKQDELDTKQSVCVKKSVANSNNKGQESKMIKIKECLKTKSLILILKDKRGKTDDKNDQVAVSEMSSIITSFIDTKEVISKDKAEEHHKSKEPPHSEIPCKVISEKQHTNESNQDADTEISSSSSESDSDTVKSKTDRSRRKNKQTARSRQYRKRQSSSSEESNSEAENEKSTVLLENGIEKEDVSTGESISKVEEKTSELNTPSAANENKIMNGDFSEAEKENKTNVKKENRREKTKKVPDLSIYQKRTVGTKLEEARRRFLERKAAREANNIFF